MATAEQPGKPAAGGMRARLDRRLPYWAPQLVVLGAIVLDLGLPDKVTIGPRWLLPAVEGALLLGLVIASPEATRARHSPARRRVAIGLTALVSTTNMVSLVLLADRLVNGSKANGKALLLAGVVLWVTNVLLFGLWYWEVDRGGPVARACGDGKYPDFLFPQMAERESRLAPDDWEPGLIDYLYVSFTNATAFSPTDTMPLTAVAKLLMSAQALTALVTIGLVVARAVNILSA